MNYKNPENIIFYSLVSCVALVFATATRFYLLQNIKEVFTANVIFIVTIILIVAGYITILLVTKDFLIPYIGKLLLKIPYIRKKRQNDDEKYTSELQNSAIVETTSNLESIREDHRLKEEEQKRQLLETTIQYTQETFAPYATDENINRLCDYITDYYNGINLNKDVQPVNVKDLSNGDLFHYGWNIWNHFKSVKHNKQEDIACFLKVVFAHNLKDIELQTIQKKLTFNVGKFKIEKQNNLK